MHHENWHQAGWNLFYAKHHEKAINMAKDRLVFDPDDWDAWILLANCYLELHDSKSLRNAAEKLIELDPDHEVGYFLMSAGWLDKNTSKALKFIEKALELDPEQPRNYAMKGQLLRLRGFDKEAQETVAAGLELDPNDTWLLREQSIILDYQEEHWQASQTMTDALKEEPDLYDNHLYDALVAHDGGNSRRALASLKEAIRLKPDSEQARMLYPQIVKGSDAFWGGTSKFAEFKFDWNRVKHKWKSLLFVPFGLAYSPIVLVIAYGCWYLEFVKEVFLLARQKHRRYIPAKQLLSYRINTALLVFGAVAWWSGAYLEWAVLKALGNIALITPVYVRLWLVEIEHKGSKILFGALLLLVIVGCFYMPIVSSLFLGSVLSILLYCLYAFF